MTTLKEVLSTIKEINSLTSNGDMADLAESLGGFSEDRNLPGTGHNDTYDAFKHTYGTARLVEIFGDDDFVRTFMTLREDGDPREQNMDLWNNNVGIEQYHLWKEAHDMERTTDTLEQWIYDVVLRGDTTINDLEDTRQWDETKNTLEHLVEIPLSILGKLLDFFISPAHGADINPLVNTDFQAAQLWTTPPRRDPLTLDLDGDGIETTAQSGWDGVLFDHNNDGQKTGTGWISGDDGFLTLDRNNNGLIDNGGELFGDNTQLSDGTTAADGFAALADLDSNQDGLIDINDTAFANLRVWQDSNQDGISQADELKTLEQLGIASLSTAGTVSGQTQNGNTITHTGSYTKTDGSTGQTGNLALASSTFNTEYTNPLSLNDTQSARPDMHGSGRVRNLREAAALSGTLAATLDSYSAATTRDQQQAQLGALLSQWSATSSMPGLMQRAADNGYIINFTFGNLGDNSTDAGQVNYGNTDTSNAASVFGVYLQSQSEEYQAWVNKLTLLERFNGTEFINFDSLNTAAASEPTFGESDGNSYMGGLFPYKVLNMTISQPQLDLLQQSYDALKQSVYDALLPQTRFKPYLDDIGLDFIDGNFELDYSAMENRFMTLIDTDNGAGVTELFEFTHVMGSKLTDWDYEAVFTTEYFSNLSVDDTLILAEFGIEMLGSTVGTYQSTLSNSRVIGNQLNNQINGAGDNNQLYGNAGDDTINGNDGNDGLDGGAGNDILNGGSGHDTLLGGEGNDTLNGGIGTNTMSGGLGNDSLIGGDYYSSDTYLFNIGDGQDVIDDYGYAGYQDVLRFGEGISSADLTLSRIGQDLVVAVGINGDQITVKKWFDSTTQFIERFEFADGSQLNATQVTEQSVYQGTAGNDVMNGFNSYSEQFSGNAGDDTINGNDGNDGLDGGAGNDILNGGSGHDTLLGGEGNDTLNGGIGTNTMSGGLGNDSLIGGDYYSSDTYLFNIGDGQDVIDDYGYAGYQDVLRFGENISSDQLWFSRNINNLVIDHIGSDDQVQIKDWFLSTNNQIEQISVENAVLYNNKVANLVNAMAAFNVPTGTDGIIPQDVQEQLAPVIASSWTSAG